MPERNTTTVEVSVETWAALDRRKGRGDSFDDVIKRLINNSAVKMGDLEGAAPEVETGEIEDYDGDESCVEGDPISGGVCGDPAVAEQPWRHPGDEEWSVFYYCEGHDPRAHQASSDAKA